MFWFLLFQITVRETLNGGFQLFLENWEWEKKNFWGVSWKWMEVGLSVSYFLDYGIMANHVDILGLEVPLKKKTHGTKSQKCLILIVN